MAARCPSAIRTHHHSPIHDFRKEAGTLPAQKTAKTKWVTDEAKNSESVLVHEKRRKATPDTAVETTAETPTKADTLWEKERRLLIANRNATRRVPWNAAAATLLVASTGWLLAHVFGWVGLPAAATGAGVAALAFIAAVTCTVLVWKRHRDYLPEAALGSTVAVILVWIITATGWDFWLVGLWLATTLACGARLWRANPVGPLVPELLPPPPPAPAPGKELVLATSRDLTRVVEGEVVDVHDEIVELWDRNISGKILKHTCLRDRVVEEYVNRYVVELDPGTQDFNSLAAARSRIASGLKTKTSHLLLERHPDGEHLANLAVVTKDPIAEVEFYTGPVVEKGVIKDLARFQDGVGMAEVAICDSSGVIPTMVVGSTGSGKSAATNTIYVGAMSEGVRNDIYMDPKGNSSPEIAKRARITIIGEDVKRAPELINSIVEARKAWAFENNRSVLRSTKDFPGWMLLHDEFSLVSGDTYCAEEWRKIVNIVRSLDMWPIALNQALQEVRWGGDQTRSAFAQQVIACRIASNSGSDLVPGLEFKPVDLPTRPDGKPVRGMAVMAGTARSNVPCRWKWLPNDDDVAEIDGEEVEPPLRLGEALDRYVIHPDIHQVDYDAIVSVLGEPVNGRWVVGPGGTHSFPVELDEDGNEVGSKKRGRKSGRVKIAPSVSWDKVIANTDSGDPEALLTTIQRSVLAVVRGGTTKTGEIKDAAKGSESAIHEALDELCSRGLITKVKRGTYEAVENLTTA